MISRNLRRFNQIPEWNVRQVLPIRGFFMSALHLATSDAKYILPIDSIFVERCICSLLILNSFSMISRNLRRERTSSTTHPGIFHLFCSRSMPLILSKFSKFPKKNTFDDTCQKVVVTLHRETKR